MDPDAKRIGRLRALVAVVLVAAAVIVGVVSYLGVDYTERRALQYQFNSTVDAAISNLKGNFRSMDTALSELARTYVDLNPTLEDWPNAELSNFQTYGRIANKIGGFGSVALTVRVKPAEVSSFEAFMINYWDQDPAFPPGSAGIYSLWPYSRGLWAVNDTGFIREAFRSTHHETTGATTWGEGKHIFALSQILYTEIRTPPGPLGYNLYSTEIEGEAIDRLVGCVDDNTFNSTTLFCGATSKMTGVSNSGDFLELTDTDLTSVTSFRSVSIVVGTDTYDEIVGAVGGQFSYDEQLSRIFADDVSGIDIVVKHRGFTLTCRIKNGVAKMIGGSIAAGYGDVASRSYAQHKVHVADALQSSQSQGETDEEYNLDITFYPTEEFVRDYLTPLPFIVACSGVMLILLVSLVFVGYDVAVRGQAARKEIVLDTVRGEAARKEIVLETKRRFVRFVSHEIRTPMNAVRLGMTLFSTEIDGLVGKLAGKSLEEVTAVLQETVADWRQIAVDVLDNCEAAVDVLNDLLNYDKIETGSLKLEFTMVPVWKVLQRTFKTFVLQAREKGIVFQLQGEMYDADGSLLVGDLGHLHCLGDDKRIEQVLRNLMSNSLKFTEKMGAVTVLAEYLPDGLPFAVIPQAPSLLLDNPRAGAVRITVVDDGAGLSPAQVIDIGKEGVQFNANTLQAGGGSGLGLFIGKGIAEQHGGTMQVSSEGLGKGATF
ncbi:hypothetical protein B484DRAFT_404234, partial [Ochromonadaceae sp. CCMP2298]